MGFHTPRVTLYAFINQLALTRISPLSLGAPGGSKVSVASAAVYAAFVFSRVVTMSLSSSPVALCSLARCPMLGPRPTPLRQFASVFTDTPRKFAKSELVSIPRFALAILRTSGFRISITVVTSDSLSFSRCRVAV